MSNPWVEEWRDDRFDPPRGFAPYRDEVATALHEAIKAAELANCEDAVAQDVKHAVESARHVVEICHLAQTRGGDLALGELLPARRFLNTILSRADEVGDRIFAHEISPTVVRHLASWCEDRITTYIDEGRREILAHPHTFRFFDLVRRERCDEQATDETFDLLFELPRHVASGRWPRNGVGYAPTPISRLIPLIRFLELTEEDSFCDVGCGIGRPSLLVAITTRAASYGIECSARRFSIAQRIPTRWNLANLHFAREEAVCSDLFYASVLFLYNPLRSRVYPGFIDRLTERAARSGFPRRICTFAGRPDLFEARGWRVVNDPRNRSEEVLVFERTSERDERQLFGGLH